MGPKLEGLVKNTRESGRRRGGPLAEPRLQLFFADLCGANSYCHRQNKMKAGERAPESARKVLGEVLEKVLDKPGGMCAGPGLNGKAARLGRPIIPPFGS